MYFNDVNPIKLEQLIEEHEKIYAHIDGERIETIKEHADLVLYYLNKIIIQKQLNPILCNLENKLVKNISDEAKNLFREMLLNTIYLHDIGKINSNFQYYKMNNKYFTKRKDINSNNPNHSMLSALIYINYFLNKIKTELPKEDQSNMAVFMLLNAYVISKHHGDLDGFDEFREKMIDGEGKRLYTEQQNLFINNYTTPIAFDENLLNRIFQNVLNNISKREQEERESSINLYIYVRFVSSLLLSCDYYATSHFKNQKEIKGFGEINDISRFYDLFKETKIYGSISRYKSQHYGKTIDFSNVQDINVLRNELFLDAEKSLLNKIDKNIFYLEAPTGSGKSNVAFNLSFLLAEQVADLNKIFYVYPFNTLIEQNINTLQKTFGDSEVMNDIAVINSVVPIKTRKQVTDDEDSDVMVDDYEISLLDRQFLHYPIVLTTHISIFNYLFGTQKNDLFPLCQIANSIIILDEIQSYKNDIWKEIITFLHYYAEVLNIKIIIMSATLPNLNMLMSEETETVNLVEDREKYFSNPIFKNRVILDFSLLEVTDNIEEVLLDHVLKTAQEIQGNILIEFIKKKTADKFYKKLKYQYEEMVDGGREIELITGDDNPAERNKIIEKIKKNKNVILVATQVIEAGVDIDMDVGYKDISLLDAEEQFLGRINRSCMKQGSKVFFFNYDEPAQVYRMDVRKEKHLSLLTEEMREILINKNFSSFYNIVLETLNKSANKLNDSNFDYFLQDVVQKLNFDKIEKKMQLIDERYEYSIFLSREIMLDENTTLDGKKVWQEYIDLLKNNQLDYAEKKIRLSQISAKLYYFIYKVANNNFTYQESIGDIYYIEDGDKYFTDGKFDREKFNQGYSDFIF